MSIDEIGNLTGLFEVWFIEFDWFGYVCDYKLRVSLKCVIYWFV